MPRVLVANALDGSVTFYDATTRKKLKTVKVGASPQGIALARNGKYGYVTNAADGTISILDVIRMSETQRVVPPTLEEPSGVAVLPDGRSLFITSGNNGHVVVLDAQSGALRHRIEVGGSPTACFAIAPSGDRVYLADPRGNRVLAVDPRSGTFIGAHDVPGGPASVALARDSRTLLVALRDNARLAKFDWNTGNIVGYAETGRIPVCVEAHPYQDAAYVLSRGGGSVQVVDLGTMASGLPVPVGLGPTRLAVARAGKTLYVTNSESDSLSVVDVLTRKVTDTWQTGHHPGAVAFLS